MLNPLRYGPTVYNGHLRGPVTLTPVAERLAVELSLPVLFLRLMSVATGDRTLISYMRSERFTPTPPRRCDKSEAYYQKLLTSKPCFL